MRLADRPCVAPTTHSPPPPTPLGAIEFLPATPEHPVVTSGVRRSGLGKFHGHSQTSSRIAFGPGAACADHTSSAIAFPNGGFTLSGDRCSRGQLGAERRRSRITNEGSHPPGRLSFQGSALERNAREALPRTPAEPAKTAHSEVVPRNTDERRPWLRQRMVVFDLGFRCGRPRVQSNIACPAALDPIP